MVRAQIAAGWCNGKIVVRPMFNSKYLSGVLLAFCAVISATATAQTSVWQVSKGDSKLYIAGTVHMLPPNQFPLPDAFSQSYQRSEKVFFEADIRELETAKGAQLLMRHARYQDERNLKQVLSASTYQQLEQAAASLGISLKTLNSFKPDFVLLNLMQVAMQRAGMAGEGVDSYFLQQALSDNKTLGFLETTEQQLSLLLNASESQEDEFVKQNLAQFHQLEQQLNDIIAAWRSGDTSALAKLAMAFTDTPEGKQFYDTLLVQRNKNWLPHIVQMLETPEVEMVLVGALHLAGEHNVLQLLQQNGYSITQLQ